MSHVSQRVRLAEAEMLLVVEHLPQHSRMLVLGVRCSCVDQRKGFVAAIGLDAMWEWAWVVDSRILVVATWRCILRLIHVRDLSHVRWQSRVRRPKVLLTITTATTIWRWTLGRVLETLLLLLLLHDKGCDVVQLLYVLHAVLLELGRDEILQRVIRLGHGILRVLRIAHGMVLVRQGSHIFRQASRCPGNSTSGTVIALVRLLLLVLLLLVDVDLGLRVL